MKINLEKMLKMIMGVKDEEIEKELIRSGFIYEYELDHYVAYRGEKIKVLYDTQNKCIVGYREIERR